MGVRMLFGGLVAGPISTLIFVLGLMAHGARIMAQTCKCTLQTINIEASHVLAGRMKLRDGVVEPGEVLMMGGMEPIFSVLLYSLPGKVHLLSSDAAILAVVEGFRPREREAEDSGRRLHPILPI
jgi:hypothetical protein